MLRPIVLLLLVLNLGFLAWSQGWVEPLGLAPAPTGREPDRLKRQVAPDSIKIVPASVSATAARPAPPVCLESPPLAGDEGLRAAVNALEQAGVPASAYTDQRSDVAGVWGVSTARMADSEVLARKEATLKRLHIAFEPLKGYPDEEPGLLISRHASAQAAQKALDALSQRSIKGLRVLVLSAPGSTHRLRVAQADAGLQDRLTKLKDAALGTGFAACAAPAEASASASAPASAPGATASAASR